MGDFMVVVVRHCVNKNKVTKTKMVIEDVTKISLNTKKGFGGLGGALNAKPLVLVFENNVWIDTERLVGNVVIIGKKNVIVTGNAWQQGHLGVFANGDIYYTINVVQGGCNTGGGSCDRTNMDNNTVLLSSNQNIYEMASDHIHGKMIAQGNCTLSGTTQLAYDNAVALDEYFTDFFPDFNYQIGDVKGISYTENIRYQ